MKKFLLILSVFILSLFCTSCQNTATTNENASETSNEQPVVKEKRAEETNSDFINDANRYVKDEFLKPELKGTKQDNLKKPGTIIIAASETPHAEILEQAREGLKAKGYELEIKIINDFVTPNEALGAGDIDANFFQHIQWLNIFKKEHKINLKSAGGIHIEPLGIYSTKIKSLDELKDGDSVIIPEDPTNSGRTLKILENYGIIKLNPDATSDATKKEIIENPKNLDFIEVEASLIPKSYQDATIGGITSNYALQNGVDTSTALVAGFYC